MNRRTVWGSIGLTSLWGCLVFCYLNACGPLWFRWSASDYVHGYAVVPFACFLLWYRRNLLPGWGNDAKETTSETKNSANQTANSDILTQEAVSPRDATNSTKKSATGEHWARRLVREPLAWVVGLLLLGAAIQIAGQICWYQVQTAALVASRDTVPAESTEVDTPINIREISIPNDLAEVLKYGVPGVAVETGREQILQSVAESPAVGPIQRVFAKEYGDQICLAIGWLCFIAATVVLIRRERTVETKTTLADWLRSVRPGPGAIFCGVVTLMAGGCCRILGSFLSDPVLYPASMVPLLLGIVLLIGGWRLTRWAWPSIVFLVFMIPLPELLSIMFADKLQLIGTTASVWLLQLGGVAADASGNVIALPNGHQMGVIEACSGLKMLVLFFCICTGGMFLMRGGVVEKLVVLCSAIPIAMLANIARITITGYLYMHADSQSAEKFFHDGAGAFMAPFAMLLLWGEIELLGMLLVPIAPDTTNQKLMEPAGTEDPVDFPDNTSAQEEKE